MDAGESGNPLRDYIPLILESMAAQETAQRALAQKTGINKTRLGILLLRDPANRSRSEERCVGKECYSTCRSGWSLSFLKIIQTLYILFYNDVIIAITS